MKKLCTFISLFCLTLTFGQVKKDLGDFTSVKVSDKLPVKLVKSSKNYVEVSGSQAEDVRFVNKNNKLKIRMTPTSLLEGDKAQITLHYKDLDEILANAGAKITSDETIKTSMLNLRANKGSYINLDLDLKKLTAKTNSGGEIAVSGSADLQVVTSNSGGHFEGKDFKTKHTEVTVKAGGEATVYASKTAEAKTRAGGSIDIFGGADVDEQKFAGGDINIH